jgi:hypothetical protein
MIPIGYMYKTISEKPDWLKTNQVSDIYSVSGCVSEDFAEWINYWKHNGYWFFDSPKIIENVALEHSLSLHGMKLFFYLAYEQQWETDGKKWESYSPEESFSTNVILPHKSKLEGYDIISFYCRTSAECSPLSCNHMAQEIKVNSHCLLDSFEKAKELLEGDAFNNCEPGPYRIYEVHTIENT